MSRGAHSEAIPDWNRLLALDPTHAVAAKALARIYSNGPSELRHPEKALAYARKAVALNPGRDIATFERAKQDRYSSFELLFLAMSYHGLAEPERAKSAFAQAVEIMERKNTSNWLLPNELQNLRAEAEALLKEED